jgi:LPS export ABC transporter protein LptC
MFSPRRRFRASRACERAVAGGLAGVFAVALVLGGPALGADRHEEGDPGKARDEAREERDEADTSKLPETLDLAKLTYVDSQRDKSGVILEAADARVLPRREQVLMQTVALRLATANAKGELRVSCDHGELDLKSGSFVGIGKVRGRTPDGRRFETERLRYDHEAGLVTTDAPVVIRDGGGMLRGGGFRYQVREGRLKLLGGASVVQEQ